jgi:hypothetical protein
MPDFFADYEEDDVVEEVDVENEDQDDLDPIEEISQPRLASDEVDNVEKAVYKITTQRGKEIEVEPTVLGYDDDGEPILAEPQKGIGTVTINGKEYKKGQFKPGNKVSGNRAILSREGQKTDAEIERQLTNKLDKIEGTRKNLTIFRGFMRTYGVARMMRIMEHLGDEDFMKTFIFMAPYCLPKIASVDYRGDDEKAATEGKKATTHVITVRNMNTGITTEIRR